MVKCVSFRLHTRGREVVRDSGTRGGIQHAGRSGTAKGQREQRSLAVQMMPFVASNMLRGNWVTYMVQQAVRLEKTTGRNTPQNHRCHNGWEDQRVYLDKY